MIHVVYLCMEQKNRQISLALYIHWEYNKIELGVALAACAFMYNKKTILKVAGSFVGEKCSNSSQNTNTELRCLLESLM